jgi:8-oxo-dGTP diphosphatase
LNTLEVAIAVIQDEQNRILITQRPLDVPHGGLWEFPGGKLNPQETAAAALVREIKEEIGLEVLQHQFLGEIHHQYPDQLVKLMVFKVTQYLGIPACLEDQMGIQWMHPRDLTPAHFPKANQDVFKLLSHCQPLKMLIV